MEISKLQLACLDIKKSWCKGPQQDGLDMSTGEKKTRGQAEPGKYRTKGVRDEVGSEGLAGPGRPR